jgi:hypothetical protein
MNQRYTIAFFLLLAYACVSWGQAPLQQRISLQEGNVQLVDALSALVVKSNVKLVFDPGIIPNTPVNATVQYKPLKEVLDLWLSGTRVRYRLSEDLILLELVAAPPPVSAFTVSGTLKDALSGELLIGAFVRDSLSGKTAVTNEYGFFSLSLLGDKALIQCYYLGYEPLSVSLNAQSAKSQVFLLSPSPLSFPVVVVRPTLVQTPASGSDAQIIKGEDLNLTPSLLGEPDLIRMLPLLPGVTTGTDGVEGIHVRGGNPEQNLVLIDDVPVYNIYHVAGVFSVFNTSAIRTAEIIKGGFPARYGGRLSSVLNVRTKEGNSQRYSGEFNLGMLALRATLEGPIIKDKCAFFISGRQSFLDWYIRPLSSYLKENRGERGDIGYQFHDLNAKLHYRFSFKDVLYLSYYNGSDFYNNDGFRSDTLVFLTNNKDTLRYRSDQSYVEQLEWGNKIASLRWNHIFGDKLFSNTVLTYSKLEVGLHYYDTDSVINLRNQSTEYKVFNIGDFRSAIEDIGIKSDFDLSMTDKRTVRFGAGITRRFFSPGALAYDDGIGNVDPGAIKNESIGTLEYFAYMEQEWRLKNGGLINAGVHGAGLRVQNKSYFSPQPRLAAMLPLGRATALRLYGSRMTQFLHLLSSSGIGLPTDLWVPATAKIKPGQAWQAGAGFDVEIKRLFDFSADIYFKYMTDLVSFSEGAFFLNDWQENVTIGNGRSYGLELMWKKSTPKTTAWVAYSLSWTDRQFDKINFGRRYPFKYDRRHDLKIVVSQKLTKWLSVSADWVFSSGFAFSIPLEQFNVDLTDIIFPPQVVGALAFGNKNQYRMPNYHRLDLSANVNFGKRSLRHRIQLGFYNVYNRRNPLYYNVRTRYVNENYAIRAKKEFVQTTLIPFLPSLNYAVSF